MGKILGVSLIFCIFFFGHDAQETIRKIESNQAKITDLEADIEIETSIQGRAEWLVQVMKIWQAKDGEGNVITRTEFFVRNGEGEKRGKGDEEKVI
ncbi:MAG: hypothetical protein ABIL40_08545, partial [candidate division WOR-3 bacterium]